MLELVIPPVLIGLAVSGVSAADGGADPPPAVPPTHLVTYKTTSDVAGAPVQLQMHIFNPAGHTAVDRGPAIVFFFGGGWNDGTPTQFYPQCAHLAQRGMVAMAAEYRVASRQRTTPQACVRDAVSAIRWARAHAAELGIDPQRLAAGGGSAGGHIAAATATLAGYDEPGEDTAVSSRPNALVLFNPVIDNGPDGYGHDRVKDYWQNFSPLHNLGPQVPPCVVFLGTADNLIPVATGEAWQKRMQELGLRCDLHLYAGQPHGFFNAKYPDNHAKTMAEMDAFLVSLGWLPPAP